MSNEWAEIGTANQATWDQEGPVQGLLVAKKTNVGPNGSNMYSLEQDNHELINVWGSTVLDTKFEQVPLGYEVRVEYLGKVKSQTPGRSPYKDYKVLVRKPEDAFPGSTEVD